MSRSMRWAVLSLLLAGVLAAPSASARDSTWRRLDQVLERLERAPRGVDAAALSPLRPLLADLEARDAVLRERFRVTASAGLSSPAAARLAAAQAAYEDGQGRLLERLRELQLDQARHGTAERAAPVLAAAREIVARLELAERAEPLSTELRLRAPALRPPPLPAASAEASAPDAATAVAIGPIPPLLRSLADSLAGPLEIYTFVRNQIAPELYYGALKGPLETYRDRGGNDADTAALLVTLLRAKGIPARYVIGTAEVPADTLRSLVGVGGSVEDAVRVLDRATIPHEAVLGPGGIASVKLARVWAEAYLPYVNYRGLELDATQGHAWVPLDAAFKLLAPPSGVDVVGELGFDPRAAWDEYMQAPRSETPVEFVRAQVTALLAAQRPDTSYESALNARGVVSEFLGLLPNTLPYVATRSESGYDLPASLVHAVRLVGEAGGTTILDARLPASELLGSRVTLSYVPFDTDDAAVVARFGGMYRTPPYLFDVKPVVNVDGVAVAAGTAPVGFGVKYTLRLELVTPGGTETVTNTLLAGNLTALGVGGTNVTAPTTTADGAARILAGVAARYLARWNASDDELSRLLRVVPVRPTLSACWVSSAVQVEYAGGDPLFPLTYDWKGVVVDADFRPLSPVGVEQRAREAQFALLSGLEGSVLEERLLESELSVPAVSTVSAIAQAHAQGLAVHDLTRDNVEAVLPGLPFDATVKAEIREAALRGLLVRVPADTVSELAWTGVGYVLLDEDSGEAAYQLQGGHSGGATSPAIGGFPEGVRNALRDPGAEPAECAKVQPTKIEARSENYLLGTVDKKLDEPLRVWVSDDQGNPLKNACVTFYVATGRGKVISRVSGQEGDDLTVLTDERGEAVVDLRLGQHTSDLPRFYCEEGRNCDSGPDQPTQVGMNVVSATTGGVRLREPFTHFALPDAQCDSGTCQATLKLTTDATRGGGLNLKVGGLMGVSATDRFDNPVSNFEVRFAFTLPPTVGTPPAGWYTTRPASSSASSAGKVLKPKDYLDCIAGQASPGWGDCAGEQDAVTLPSSPLGAFAYAVIGDSPYSAYRFDVGSSTNPGELMVRYGTAGWLCSSPDTHACLLDQPQTLVTHGTRARRVNRFGNFIEAYPTGGNGDITLWADSLEEGNYVLEPEPGVYRARGDGTWKRVRPEDSVFDLSAATPGTSVSPAQAAHVGHGDYRAQMTMGPTPQENRVSIAARHTPAVVHYMSNDRDRVDVGASPVYEENGVKKATRTPDPSRPWQGSFEFPLWGAQARVDRLEPEFIYVSTEAITLQDTRVHTRVLPQEWRDLLDPTQVLFRLRDSGGAAKVEGLGRPGQDGFTVPAGITLARGSYTADVEVLATDVNGGSIRSDPQSAQAKEIGVDLEQPEIALASTPSEYVWANTNDDDRDAIVDFADGFNRSGAEPDDDVNAEENFDVLLLKLARDVDVTKARLRFTYDVSDPAMVTAAGTQPEIAYSAAAGRLRVWRRAGNVTRRAASVAASPAGDFVPQTIEIDPRVLGLSSSVREARLYIEGVAASAAVADAPIVAELDPDGPDPAGYIVRDNLPITVVDVELLDNGDNAKRVVGGRIGWIKAEVGQPPAMPQLTARLVPDLTTVRAGLQGAWRLHDEYQRTGGYNNTWSVDIPPIPRVPVALPVANAWDVAAEIAALPDENRFFGGDATLSVAVDGVLPNHAHQFRIRGRNPSDADARAYIDANNQGLWYAGPIMRHESYDWRGTRERYNQFWDPGTPAHGSHAPRSVGLPFFSGNPQGWGIGQLDFSATLRTGTPRHATLAEIWNWQANVRSGVTILVAKRAEAVTWMQSLDRARRNGRLIVPARPRGQRPQAQVDAGGGTFQQDATGAWVVTGGAPVAVPAQTISNCVFNDPDMEDADAIKLYNGGHFVSWNGPGSNVWQFTAGPNNYVRKICDESANYP